MIDIHTHIIPRIDDGSKDEGMTLKMLEKAVESGTTKIILTPHYFRGRFMESLKHVKQHAEQVKKIARYNDIEIEIYVGQEIYFTPSLLEDLKDGEIGTLNDSRYMLIELDMAEIEDCTLDVVYELKLKGITAVIAHPERYLEFQKKPSKINEYIDDGCLFQLNAGSIGGVLGNASKELAELYLKRGIYSFIGSDAHSDGRRNTNMKQFVQTIDKINPSFIKTSVENAQKLLNDEKVSFTGEKIELKKKKKGLFSFFRK